MGGKGNRKDAEKPRPAKTVKEQKELRQKLSDELRSTYNSILEEPLPQSMMNFLRDLDRDDADQGKKDRDDSGS